MNAQRRERYGSAAILFHWTIAALFAVQIPLGYLMSIAGGRPLLQFSLFQWHKSIGFLVLALSLLRVSLSLLRRRLEPPAGAAPAEIWLARLVHGLLLALTIAIPLTGWAVASSSPLRIPSFVFDLFVVPSLPIAISDAAEAMWSTLHAWLAYGAALLIPLHAGAALFHHIHRRDDTLRRMLPSFVAKRLGPLRSRSHDR